MVQNTLSRLILAGLSGGTGKTIVSLALTRAFKRAGKKVVPFKKGPDYIDAQWLSVAAGHSCSNLDPFFHSVRDIRALFYNKSQGSDVCLVEGNRGLFDGMDEQGSCSTAELARILDAPVILAIDCTKMTRTVAAVLQGCLQFEPNLRIAGVILNRTAGERHRSVLRKSIETHTDVPVLGMLPKIRTNPIPERHMGLVTDHESDATAQHALDALADMAEEWLDIEAILHSAATAPDFGPDPGPIFPGQPASKKVRIGYVRDASLWFYYPENLEALEHAGAELVRLSLLSDAPWPSIDGLYLGGGFPELFADRLAANTTIMRHVKTLSNAGLPIYAECGGFMVLCNSLEMRETSYPMAGVFPVGTSFCPKPQGLGYTEAEVVEDNPFFRTGSRIEGHEFHYSLCVSEASTPLKPVLKMGRGHGGGLGWDGFLHKNTVAGYNHIHAVAVPEWAPLFVAAASKYRSSS
ncbi:cobyrinate a,c-diamide synthase [Pseudodesulfovibrio sp. JC047]|uniref:cobyrinate a,c-diamide synthase n=1 Tax=Pseudodesulfovibrio sp. JC047 TaxID=2683199 RepID=UPI0013CF4603|nr:cobyrinate a,c-diamide synthase [Pseudodesulfovibrio sp. JC047]NDV20356.1 cobyrinate a,c-diamide synthase [Pseudodesulfovibrio sp. JC047]